MELTIDILIEEAKAFSQMLSAQNHSSLIGVTDGKAVGTYVEHLFQNHLSRKYTMTVGSSASGIDLRHNQKANIGWADGHVSAISAGDIQQWRNDGKVWPGAYILNSTSVKVVLP